MIGRRSILVAPALALAAFVVPGPAAAQQYPEREIRSICNFPAGSGADIVVRYFSQKLSDLAGKPVIVENKGGAQGNIGTETAAHAKPDGYTIYIAPGSSSHAAAKHLFKTLTYDPVKDFAPVTTLMNLSFVLLVDPKKNIHSVADLTAYLKSGKAKGIYGSVANTGTIATELYLNRAGLKVQKALYREAGTLVNDLTGGDIDFAFVDATWTVEQRKAGRVAALAVTGAKRTAALPDVPTMAESGFPGFDITPWWAVFVPAGTPQPIIDKLEGWFNQILTTRETKDFLLRIASDAMPGNQKMLADLLKSEIDKWGEYVRIAKIEKYE
jgi:tripartite-type tricarboxylate transporter receptor subunit TctC